MVFVGVDVQTRRGVPVIAIDAAGSIVASEWLEVASAPSSLQKFVKALLPGQVYVGIDAPRTPLVSPRTWRFSRGTWGQADSGLIGRHCELAVKALGLANPQWTPLGANARPWMSLGFELFRALEGTPATTYEVFPSASYTAYEGDESVVDIPLGVLRPGPRDLLDALIGAHTVARFATGKGCEVGGGDGLGSIVLPVPVEYHPVLDWPR